MSRLTLQLLFSQDFLTPAVLRRDFELVREIWPVFVHRPEGSNDMGGKTFCLCLGWRLQLPGV